MADVAQPVKLLKQLHLIAAVRWRMLHNNLRRKQNRLDLLGLIIVGILAGVVVFGLCILFFEGAFQFVSTGRITWVSLLFWAIFLWWQLFPIMVAGFGVSFDFRALLRFPLSFGAFYVSGLAYGLADFTGVAAICWLLSITFGVAIAKLNLLVPILVLILIFVLFNVALERLLGSWMERLLTRRRSREFFFAAFIGLMVLAQLIGPLVTRFGNSLEGWFLRALPYFAYFPASLSGAALGAASAGDFRGFALAAMGIALYAIFFGALLWMRFAMQYRGEELSETLAPVEPIRNSTKHGTEGPLGVLSPQVAAIVRKELHYLLRNGFAAMLLLVPPFLVFLLISRAALLRFSAGERISSEVFFPGLMGYIILVLMAPAYNSFAYESTGVQTYFTAPLNFRNVLLGKNCVQVSLVTAELFLCIVAFSYRVGLPAPPVLVATLVAILFTVVGQLSIANWSSLSFPRKLAFGQIHGQRQSGMAVLVAFGAQILLFGISSLVLGLGRWTGDRWLPAKAFTLLAAAAIGGYIASLDALTSYAEKKKERLIEALCR